MTFYN